MEKIGKYEIMELVGSGAYAEVYKAVDTVLRRTVALKLLKPILLSDNEAVSRFLQEAQTAASLTHPNIAWVWDLGEMDGRYYLAMRFIDGLPLDRILKMRGALPWDEAVKIVQEIGGALIFAHKRGLVHRDIKPQNIIISPDDGAVLTDFGLVRAMEAGSFGTRTGALIGTPAYMAPEIWQGEPADPAADQYSLACVLVEMLTGRPLFHGRTPPAVMRQHLIEGPRLPESWPTHCPPDLTDIIRRALAQSPEERYPDVPAFLAALTVVQPAARATGSPQEDVGKLPLSGPAGAIIPTAGESGEVPGDGSGTETAPAAPPGEVPILTRPIPPSTPEPPAARPAISRRLKLPVWAVALMTLAGLGILSMVAVRAFSGQPPANPTPVARLASATPWPPTKAPSRTATATATHQPTLTKTPTPLPRATDTQQPTLVPTLGTGSSRVRPQDGMVQVYFTDAASDPFWVDQIEVTNEMYARCLDAGECVDPAGSSSFGEYRRGDASLASAPVLVSNHEQAISYCLWVGADQLPTIAQWEIAARETNRLVSDPGLSSLQGLMDTDTSIWEWMFDNDTRSDRWASRGNVNDLGNTCTSYCELLNDPNPWYRTAYNFINTCERFDHPCKLYYTLFYLGNYDGAGKYDYVEVYKSPWTKFNDDQVAFGFRCIDVP